MTIDEELDQLSEQCKAAHHAETDPLKRAHLGGASIAFRQAARIVRRGEVGPDDFAFTTPDGREGVLRGPDNPVG